MQTILFKNIPGDTSAGKLCQDPACLFRQLSLGPTSRSELSEKLLLLFILYSNFLADLRTTL